MFVELMEIKVDNVLRLEIKEYDESNLVFDNLMIVCELLDIDGNEC